MIKLFNDLNKMLNVRDFEVGDDKLRGPGKFEQIIRTDNQKFEDNIQNLSEQMNENSQTINAILEFLNLESAVSKQLSNILIAELDSKVEIITDTKNMSAIEASVTGKISPQLITLSEVNKTIVPKATLQIDKSKIATNPGKVTICTVMEETEPTIFCMNDRLQISNVKINQNLPRNDIPDIENEYLTVFSEDEDTANIVLKINGYNFNSDLIKTKSSTIQSLKFKAEDKKSPISSFKIKLNSAETKLDLQDVKNSLDRNIKDIQITNKYESSFDGGKITLLSTIADNSELTIEEIHHDKQSNKLRVTINNLSFKSDTLDKVKDLKHIELTNPQNKEKLYLSFTEEENIENQIQTAQKELSASFIITPEDDAQSLLKKISISHEDITTKLAGNVLILTKNSKLEQNFRLQNIDGILVDNTEIAYTDSQKGYVKYEDIKIPLGDDGKLEIMQEDGIIKITVKDNYSPNPADPIIILKISDNLEEKFTMLDNMLTKLSVLLIFLKEQNEYDTIKKTLLESSYLGKNTTMSTISQTQIRTLERRLSIPDFPIRVVGNKIEYTAKELKTYIQANPDLKDVRKAIPPLFKIFNNKFNAEKEMKKIRENHKDSQRKQEKLEDEKYEKYKQNVTKMSNVMQSINKQNKSIAGLNRMMDNLNRRE